MLPRADNVVHRFDAFVHRILALEPAFQETQAVAVPERLVMKIAHTVVHHRAVVVACRFLPRGQIEGFSHAGFNEGTVNLGMALPAGVDADIPCRVGMVKVHKAVMFRSWGSFVLWPGLLAGRQAEQRSDHYKDGYAGKATDVFRKFP